MSVQRLFPTLLYNKKVPSNKMRRLNKELLSDINVLQEIDEEGKRWSKENYVGGYTSYSSISDLHLRHAPFMELKNLLDKEIKKYVKELEVDLLGRKVEMTTCWVNVMPHYVHHSLHFHPLCFISGTYYVQTPPGSGTIKFEDPRLSLYMAAPPRKNKPIKTNSHFITIKPQPGQFLFWESWLRHEVTANKGKGTRISVSFNYEWV